MARARPLHGTAPFYRVFALFSLWEKAGKLVLISQAVISDFSSDFTGCDFRPAFWFHRLWFPGLVLISQAVISDSFFSWNFGRFLIDFWSIFGRFLVHFWLIFGWFLVHFSSIFHSISRFKKQAFQHQKNKKAKQQKSKARWRVRSSAARWIFK